MQTKHLVAILILLALAVPASPAHAGGIVSVCDEAHLLTALAGGSTVTFTCSGTIILTAEITIAADTTIDGSGQDVTITGNDAVRVLVVNSGVTLNLNELTIADGNADGVYGGGVFVAGDATLSVSNSTFTGNNVSGEGSVYGGAIFVDTDGTAIVSDNSFSGNSTSGWGGGRFGAGIHNRGTLTVSNSTFTGNNAGDGGGIYNGGGTVTVSNSTFFDNTADWYLGGGIYNHWGSMTVSSSTFSGNDAENGGGILNGDGGWLTVSNSTFSENSAIWRGGGIGNLNELTVSTSTFSGNTALDGGGIASTTDSSLSVGVSTFSGNSVGQVGGGIFNAYGMLTVSNSTFSDNDAEAAGGGIYTDATLTVSNSTFSDNSAGYGGGVYTNATSTVSNSTFSNNSADDSGGGIVSGGTVTVSNSTFSGNIAGNGGGIDNRNNTLTVSNSTFSGNSATGRGGGIRNDYDGTVTMENTIVATSPTGSNCAGTITDGGGNLSYPDTTCPGINADPVLGPLQNNGGPTETMALGEGSAAIDAGNDATCAAPPVNNLDQRGFVRPWGAHCDIGALEQIQEPAAVSLSAISAESASGAIPPTIVFGLLLVALASIGAHRRVRQMRRD